MQFFVLLLVLAALAALEAQAQTACVVTVPGLCFRLQDIGQKQQAHGPLEIFDLLLPECGADYAAEMAKVSSETRGQDGRCAHMCSSYTATELSESSVPTY